MTAMFTPLQPGDPAPEFTLSTLDDRSVSLADYRGRSTLLLALFRGLYCPFCRRHIVQLAANAGKLKPLGVESLAVVATEPENARLYYRFHPVKLPIAVDPDLTTHRSYGVPRLTLTPEMEQQMAQLRFNPTGELPQPLPLEEASAALDRMEGYQPTDADHRDLQKQWPLLTGQFLIDRDGVIRWTNIEGAKEGLAGAGKFPTREELFAAAQAL